MTRKTVYNHNLVTQEKWDLVNKENKDLLEEFLDYKRNTGKSEETLYQYKSQLKIFFVWLVENAKNKEFVNITKRDLIKFQGYCLNTLGHSPNRVKAIRSAISSLSIFIEDILDEDYPDFRNIVNRIEPPSKATVRQKTVLSFEKCLEVCNKLYDEGKYQLSAFLAVAIHSGMRKQELTRLLYKDFTENKTIIFNSFYKTSPIKLKGDRHKKDNKLVWNKCDKYLNKWLEYRIENNIECEYLFCRKTEKGYEKMLVSTANSFISSLNNYFDEHVYAHSFRHLFSTHLLRSGVPAEVVQMLLSHNDVSTTLNFYDDREKDESLSKFASFFSGEVTKIDAPKSLSEI